MATLETNLLSEYSESDWIIKQFFCMTPMRNFKWGGSFAETSEFEKISQDETRQVDLISKIFMGLYPKRFPASKSYKIHFLKTLMEKCENSGHCVAEELYVLYTDLIQDNSCNKDFCYKTYILNSKDNFVLKESSQLLSSGTTGLVSWQAAFHLGEWILSTHFLKGRSVLEIGSGVGFLGILINKMVDINNYIFSDCHDKVLYILCHNLKINDIAFHTNGLDYNEQTEGLCVQDKVSSNFLQAALESDCHPGPCDVASCDEASGDATPHRVKNEVNMNLGVDQKNNDTCIKIEESTFFYHGDEEENVNEFSARSSSSRHGLASPQHGKVVDRVLTIEDVNLNGDHSEMTDVRTQIMKLDFCTDLLQWSTWQKDNLMDVDVIIATDIIFDPSIITHFVGWLNQVLRYRTEDARPPKEALVASTVRNDTTYGKFISALEKHSLIWRVLPPPSIEVFFYDRSTKIEILLITAAINKTSKSE